MENFVQGTISFLIGSSVGISLFRSGLRDYRAATIAPPGAKLPHSKKAGLTKLVLALPGAVLVALGLMAFISLSSNKVY